VYKKKDVELVAQMDIIPNIRKMCCTADGLCVTTEDGRLWCNSVNPKEHFSSSCNKKRMIELDITDQVRQCPDYYQILDVESAYEATILILGKRNSYKPDLMKILKKEAFLDISINSY
jgi:hypothetical protein